MDCKFPSAPTSKNKTLYFETPAHLYVNFLNVWFPKQFHLNFCFCQNYRNRLVFSVFLLDFSGFMCFSTKLKPLTACFCTRLFCLNLYCFVNSSSWFIQKYLIAFDKNKKGHKLWSHFVELIPLQLQRELYLIMLRSSRVSIFFKKLQFRIFSPSKTNLKLHSLK